jgi:hypothetical protein
LKPIAAGVRSAFRFCVMLSSIEERETRRKSIEESTAEEAQGGHFEKVKVQPLRQAGSVSKPQRSRTLTRKGSPV